MPDRPTILVIDDTIRTDRLVCDMLADSNRPVHVAIGGNAALDWFQSHAEDVGLVLVDQSMPDLEGTEVAERIWRRRPNLPIFLMSGLEEEEIDPLLSERPFLGFLKKPFRSWELHLRVQSVLGS